DWLVAMDAGQVLATGTPQELMQRTGTTDLEKCFIALLPEEKRTGHTELTIPPRQTGTGLAIEAHGLTRRFGTFIAVDHVSLSILAEPTSCVDTVARDSFWELLIDLSRKQGVTIFVTTHFMNEGMRCDRISLMHAGRVLAADAPDKLIADRGSASLEEAFIGY